MLLSFIFKAPFQCCTLIYV